MSISIARNDSSILLTIALVLLLPLGSFSTGSLIEAQAVSDLRVKISIHEDEVERGETQRVMVTVSDKDDRDVKITDAKVKLTVYSPESDSTTADDKTDSDGEANFKVKIDDDAELGIYDIKIRVSKSGYVTETKELSFDVVDSSSTNDKNWAKDNNDDNDGDNDDDDKNGSDDGDQTNSQGNACGNGLLSTNVPCQNVANQLHGDGNAINIIAIQTGSNEKTETGFGGVGHISNPSSPSSYFPSSSDVLGDQDRTSSLSNDESFASIVDEYKQSRIDNAIELRMNYWR